MDYVGGQAAADSLKFTKLANAQLAWRIDCEAQAQASGKEVRRDIFHHVLHARDPDTGKGFTREELQADSGLLIAAGSDGVALTISACIFYLLHNPATYSKLVSEIRGGGRFSSASDIRSPDINKLPYLMACIRETMRMSPALPASMPRLVLPGGLTISEVDGSVLHVPAGVTVGVPAYAIHHNEACYPDSWAFRPERWLLTDTDTGTGTTTTAEDVSKAHRAFCPFSAGPMDCVGKNMAYLAFKLVLANLLWRYDIRLAHGGPTGGGSTSAPDVGRRRVGEYQMVDFIAAYRDGPMIELKERAAVSVKN